MKKREPPKTSLYLFSHQLLFLFLSLTLLIMCLAIFKYTLMSKYSTMSKYATMFKWQFSSTLASFPLWADYPSIKLTSENVIKTAEDCKYFTSTHNLPKASFDLSRLVQTVQFLPNNDTISYVIYLSNTTNKTNIDWSLIKFKRVTRGILSAELYAITQRFDSKKWYWGRYQIMSKKSYQYQHYGMGETGKHEIGNTKRANTGIWQLLERVASVTT